nr:hypothetical protein B0A51_06994 [Rachicladosporium sp. CCFEE 5018]
MPGTESSTGQIYGGHYRLTPPQLERRNEDVNELPVRSGIDLLTGKRGFDNLVWSTVCRTNDTRLCFQLGIERLLSSYEPVIWYQAKVRRHVRKVMRLYNVNTLTFQRFYSNPPRYVIASHRWAHEVEEITFQDVLASRNTERIGYKKLNSFITYVKSQHRDVDWLWIDTCCIDKTNAVELSEAITSMYKWYRNAEVCLAYLSDVLYPNEENAPASNLDEDFAKLFRQSDWFTRGWTLQELVAPKVVVFLAADWKVIGYKGERTQRGPFRALEEVIATITRIPRHVLDDASTLDFVNVETRLHWATERRTTREEDQWYCLYSLLDAPIGANYGEGVKRARKRLLADLEDSGSIKPGRAAAIAQRLDVVKVTEGNQRIPNSLQSLARKGSNAELRSTKVVIENIPFHIKKEDLLMIMAKKRLPPPQDMQYRFVNGVSRGKAVASFTKRADAVATIDDLNNTELHHRKLKVDYEVPAEHRLALEGVQSSRSSDGDTSSRCTEVVFENLPFAKQELEVFMSNRGLILPRDIQYRFSDFGGGTFRGVADASFADHTDAAAAVQTLNNAEVNGRNLRVYYAAKPPRLLVPDLTLWDRVREQRLMSEVSDVWQAAAERTPREVLRDVHPRSETAYETSTRASPMPLPLGVGALDQYTELADTSGSRNSRNTSPRQDQGSDQASEKQRGFSLRDEPRQLRRQPGVYPTSTEKKGFSAR